MTVRTGTVLDGLSPARRRFALVAIIVPVSLLAIVVVTRTAGGRDAPVAQDRPGPVLLVSGYGGSTRSLEPLRRTLEDSGREVVVVPPVDGGTGDITTQAEELGAQADAAMQRHEAGSVDVVGYSAGGVVARRWVSLDGDRVARRVLSIGSPQHGTSVAALARNVAGQCPTACRQLEPDSDLLRSLNARDETPRGPVFVSVWSTADALVVPPDSARLDGAMNLTVQSICPTRRTSHGDLPTDPVVQAALLSTLGVGPPRAPAGVDCAGSGVRR